MAGQEPKPVDMASISDRLTKEAEVQARMAAHYREQFQAFLLDSALGSPEDINKALADMRHVSIIRRGDEGIEVRGAQFLMRSGNKESSVKIEGTCFVGALENSMNDKLPEGSITVKRSSQDLLDNSGSVIGSHQAVVFVSAKQLKQLGMELPALTHIEKAALNGHQAWVSR